MTDHTDLLNSWNSTQDAIALQNSDFAISTLTHMVESNSIDVSPGFQRRDRWSPEKQSRLIESFLLNLPVPPVYLAEEQTGGTYSVIDGRQRLTAIRDFLTDELKLTGLSGLEGLNGIRHSMMPEQMKLSLAMRPLRCTTLLRQTNPDFKYLVFHRLNTGGEPLNAQEIRNVVYRGPLNKMLLRLSTDEWFGKVLKITSHSSAAYKSMQDAEYVLRFLTLSSSWRTFSGDLSKAMDQFMHENRNADPAQLAEYEGQFTRALSRCRTAWGGRAFRRPDRDTWRDQPLAGLYDAQMISASELSQDEANRLESKSDKLIETTRRLFTDEQFDKSVRTGTNTPSRVGYRIDRMLDALKETLA